MDHVLELAHVAGPVVAREVLHRVGGHPGDPLARIGRILGEEVLHESRHVLEPLPERRQVDRKHHHPVVEVLSEGTVPRQLLEVTVRGRDDPYVELDLLGATHPLQAPLLQHPQQSGLGRRRHLAHLVEEDGATGGLLELAGMGRHGAGEGTLLVAEQLALLQPLRDGGTVDIHERTVGADRPVVDRLCHEFLAGPALAGNEHRDVRLQHLLDLVVHRAHGCRRAHDVAQVVPIAQLALEPFHLLGEAVVGHRPSQGGQQPLLVHRLGQVVVCAKLGELYRPTDVVHRGDHDDRQRGETPPELLEHLGAVHLGHHQIEQHRSRRLARAGQHLLAGGKRLRRKALTSHQLREQETYARIIVHNPNQFAVSHGHGQFTRCIGRTPR
jgi:hypothetical protein